MPTFKTAQLNSDTGSVPLMNLLLPYSFSLSLATPSSRWLLRPKTVILTLSFSHALNPSANLFRVHTSPLVLLKPWFKSFSSFTWIILTISLVSLQSLLASVCSQHRHWPYSGVNQVTLLFKTFQLHPKCLSVRPKSLFILASVPFSHWPHLSPLSLTFYLLYLHSSHTGFFAVSWKHQVSSVFYH